MLNLRLEGAQALGYTDDVCVFRIENMDGLIMGPGDQILIRRDSKTLTIMDVRRGWILLEVPIGSIGSRQSTPAGESFELKKEKKVPS